ncbi:hypothetical protein DM01DRAFT_1146333 [Hesseltinella vesiculosa]|uniref:PAS domain-containing protein n=1 Tax=Hesseltinella vesiculosa TaxID=101127 RepID=A0A1X2G7J5_9FUNG|nr:hypothetical protein DM01DRAFT_1146333 [Hesseltinella vesiculosa]
MTMTATPHGFDGCPLRSSSLLIVNHKDQVIVTASDQVFDMLGYSNSQPEKLLHQSTSILSFSTLDSGKHQHCVNVRHAQTQQWLQLRICIHRDPFLTSGLDYCLVQKIVPPLPFPASDKAAPITLLGLNAYGTIVRAHPSNDFPHPDGLLVGRPIMAFIHSDDVLSLCGYLKQSCEQQKRAPRSRRHLDPLDLPPTDGLLLRWLIHSYYCDPFDERTAIWMNVQVIHPTQSCVHGQPAQPICLLQPLLEDDGVGWKCWYEKVDRHRDWSLTFEDLHRWAEQMRYYCLDYVAHLMTSMIQLVQDLAPTLPLPLICVAKLSSLTMKPNSSFYISSFIDTSTDMLFDRLSSFLHPLFSNDTPIKSHAS